MSDDVKRLNKPSLKLIANDIEASNGAVLGRIKPGTKKTARLSNGLTVKQETFARLVAEGANYSDAYRQAFDCDNGSMNTINGSASRLAARDKIKARIDEHRASIQEHGERVAMRAIDRWHETLWSIADNSRNDGARVSALREIGKALGITDASKADDVKQKASKDILKDIQDKLGKLNTASK